MENPIEVEYRNYKGENICYNSKKKIFMKEWAQKLKPKNVITILDAYMKTVKKQEENKDIKVPLLVITLQNRISYSGCVLHCDFSKNMLTFEHSVDRHQTAFTFISFNAISHISLIDVDLCKEFLDIYNEL